VPLAGRPMVEWSIAAFRECEPVRSIVVACPPGHEWALGGDDLQAVEGGETRSASVSNALEAVETDLVAIHDAARPLVTPELIEGVVSTLIADEDASGAIAAAPVTDTIKRDRRSMHFPPYGEENASIVVEKTLDRGRLWAAQTPQVFRTEALRKALGTDLEQIAVATDEAMLVEAAGGRVLIHPSPAENIKVTTPLDLRLAELLLESGSR
jgi:2-C-methyl-D-erythritol 4-phosphate cytidylyltransferase